MQPMIVIFACVHNAGRSQMAAAFFNSMADPTKVRAVSAGTKPGPHVHSEVLATMREIGIDLSRARPRPLTKELLEGASLLVTMGCGEECPFVPGLQRENWLLDDPKDKSIEQVRLIRDAVRSNVADLLTRKFWGSIS